MLEALDYLNEKGATISDIDHNALFCTFCILINPYLPVYYKASLFNVINFLLDHGGRFSHEFSAIMPLFDRRLMLLNKR